MLSCHPQAVAAHERAEKRQVRQYIPLTCIHARARHATPHHSLPFALSPSPSLQGQEAITLWQHCIQLYQTALAQMAEGAAAFELEFNLGTACMQLAGPGLARACTAALAR